MHRIIVTGLLIICSGIHAQVHIAINESEISRIEKTLAADDMMGRKVFTSGIEKAASFIIQEFKVAGLQPLPGSNDFKQTFTFADPDSMVATIEPDGHVVDKKNLTNLVGLIPGKSKPDEYVIFSAHYDHLGVGQPDAMGDSIYNGANDDASGTTAVIALANYFSKLRNNERTVIFAAFTAEEAGEIGSDYFSNKIDPAKIIAMFNIEMIGTESKWGKNSAYITGFDKSDIGTILQRNLKNSQFKFYPDPYPEQMLFLRSDNATLAKRGVPAHSISTSKMDSEKLYHQRGDEVETLDLQNMTEIIRAIGLSAGSIIAGKDTPYRVKH